MPRHCLCALIACIAAFVTVVSGSIDQSNNELNNEPNNPLTRGESPQSHLYSDPHTQTLGCVTCEVTACIPLTGQPISIQLPRGSPSSQQAPCSLLNSAISRWMPDMIVKSTSESSNTTLKSAAGFCDTTIGSPDNAIGQLACEQVVVMNQTQNGCAIVSMSQDPSFARACTSLTQCDVSQSELLTRADACRSSTNFVKALIFDSAIPIVHDCRPCVIEACSNDPNTAFSLMVSDTSPDAQLGNTCDSLKVGIAHLVNSPANPMCEISRRQAVNATCWPLLYASQKQVPGDTCSLSSVLYEYYDTVHYDKMTVSQSAFMWPTVCPRYLSSIFDKSTADKLQQMGFCNSPTDGLLSYADQFNSNSSHLATSSTGPGATNSSPSQRAGWLSLAALLTTLFVIFF